MSIQATNKVLEFDDFKPSSVKFVLFMLANYANEDMVAYPSVATLARKTGQDDKTVGKNLGILVNLGLIEDTGFRVGHTKQVIVYKLNLTHPKVDDLNTPKNGTLPKTEDIQISPQTPPNFPLKTPKFPPKDPQKRSTEPLDNHKGTVIEPIEIPEWIDPDLWASFVDMRKQIKKPMSVAAAKLLITKLEGFRVKGFDVTELISNSIIGGWPSVYEPKTSNKPSGTAAFDPVAYINQNRTSKQGGSHESIDGSCQRMD